MDLTALQIADPEALLNDLAPQIRQGGSIEQVSTLLCQTLHDRCLKGAERSLVLSRVYLSLPYSSLDSGGAQFARETFGIDPKPADLFLCLVGTWGDQEEWKDLRRSKGHRAIPLNRETVTTVPMLARCFQQIGFDLEVVLAGEKGIRLEGVSRSFGLFHVEDAQGSPYIPAQDGFVKPLGVRSALGCGTMLPNGAVSIWIGFSRHTVTASSALALVPMMPAFWMHASPLYRKKALYAR
ncbi:MAG: hypothetical protein AAB434_13095 [Planctomycetota bacterium]